MKSLSDQELLREYLERRSEPAFTELVHRHVDLVYSCALRIVRDAHLAQDVTQSVFTAAAQNAEGLAEHPVVLGWLHRTTQNVAANAVRQEVRRREREQMATTMNEVVATNDSWEAVEPHIEEALGRLKDQDRDVVLLRFFQGKSAREIAAVIGTSEEAAQKRVNRGVERVRKFLVARGIRVGTGSLGIALLNRAVNAAPMGLADRISRAVTQDFVIQIGSVTAAKGIVMTTTHKAIVTMSVALAVGTGVYEVQQSRERHREANRSEQAFAELHRQLEAVRRERDRGFEEIQALRNEAGRLKNQAAEVHRLRGDLTQLRADAAKARAEQESVGSDSTFVAAHALVKKVEILENWLQQRPDQLIPEFDYLQEEDWIEAVKEYTMLGEHAPAHAARDLREKAKREFAHQLSNALRRFVEENRGQAPASLLDLNPLLSKPLPPQILDSYELLRTEGMIDPLKDKWLVAEIAPPFDRDDGRRLMIGLNDFLFIPRQKN